MKYKVTNQKNSNVTFDGIFLKPGESVVLDKKPSVNDLHIEVIKKSKEDKKNEY